VGRSIVVATLLAAGCTLAPRKFHDLADPSPLVRARAVSLGDGMPDATVVPALLDRLGDPDPVVRLTAHEELKRRTGQDFGYRPWDDAEAREAAAQAWRAWWDGLRAAPGRPYGP
jgi:HEAT repeat protein